MDEGEAAFLLELAGMGIGRVERVAFEHDLGAVAFGLRHFHDRRVGRHHDRRRNAQAVRVIGEALGMIARRRRDHALGARRVVELEQGVERAAFLIGRGELEVLELEIDRRAGQV